MFLHSSMTTKVRNTVLAIGCVTDYHPGVLQRHESLAANLGAKLTGPLLVKSFEKLFEGPIRILSAPYVGDNTMVTWLDVVEYATNNSHLFALSDSIKGGRVCQFWTNGCHVEISEDDYRLILSGAPEKMILKQPIAEDEAAEVGTLEILEQRLGMLIKKADLVAGRARQLNYHLKVRKTAINNRRQSVQGQEAQDSRPSTGFQPVNRSRTNGNSRSHSPALHQDLLRQFLVEDGKSFVSSPQGGSRVKPLRATSEHGGPPTSHPASSSAPPNPVDHRRPSHMPQSSTDDGTGGQYRPMMTAKIERLPRGNPIWPPCDRSIACQKHLTACSGCTKKHAKCSWRDIEQVEIEMLVKGEEGEVIIEPSGVDGQGQPQGQGIPMEGVRNGTSYGESVSSAGGASGGISPRVNSGERGQNGAGGLSGVESRERDDHSLLSQMASAAAAVASAQ